MSEWYAFNDGQSLGQKGSEGGTILHDEEHGDGARATLEHVVTNRFKITCGIYGWMVHTRFFDSETAALIGFDETKVELTKILALIPKEDEANDERMRVAPMPSLILLNGVNRHSLTSKETHGDNIKETTHRL